MANRVFITVEASAAYVTNAPTLEVLIGGVVVSSATVTAHTGVGTSVLSFSLDYTGSYPSSVSFRFNDGFAEVGRSVTIATVRANGTDVGNANLSSTLLSLSQSSNLNMTNTDHLFGRVEPVAADLGTVTHNGTAAVNTITGTTGNDVIDGQGGNDKLNGGDGDDKINGNSGNDTISGGSGNDLVMGDIGNDNVFGNAGDDLLYGNAGTDIMDGGAGKDVLNGGSGNDILQGGADDDIVYGETGNDIIIGGLGDDYIFGDDDDDTIDAGYGNDTVYGGNGIDLIAGGAGNDTVYGEAGADQIDGGNGTDTIDGGDGNDIINGGLSADILSGGNDDDIVIGDNSGDTISGDAGNDVLVGGSGADTVTGGDGVDIIYGHSADSTVAAPLLTANPGVTFSTAGNSFYKLVVGAVDYATASAAAAATLVGGVAGHLVTIQSSAENAAVLTLAAGNTIWLGASDATVEGEWRWQGGTENNMQFWSGAAAGSAVNNFYTNWAAGQPDDSGNADGAVMGGTGTWSDTTAASSFAYIIEWDGISFSDDNAIDVLFGGNGNDMLQGGGGNDTMSGDANDDILLGGAGNDTMLGGTGADYMNGGAGNDAISLANGDFAANESIDGDAGTDTVTLTTSGTTVDFTTGTLAGLETLTGSGGNDTVTMYATSIAGMFTTVNLGTGTDNLYIRASGTMNVSAATIAATAGVENGFIVGTATDDVLTITATQFNAIIAGTGTVDFGAGTGDTINLSGTTADLNTLGVTDASIQGLEAVSFATAAAGVTLDLSAQTEAFTITGSASADTITAGTGADVIDAGGGNDTINLANGAFAAGESITGGAATDTVILTNATTVDFTTGTLATLETLTGSGSNDVVTMLASSAAGMFTTINLGAGAADVLSVVGTSDISAATVATISNVETGNIIGTTGNDSFTLTGTQFNAFIIGAGLVDMDAGTDTITLTSLASDLATLAGTDSLIEGLEVISYASVGSSVTLDLSAQTEGFTLTGGSAADTLTMGDGDDIVTGGAGVDTIVLGEGTNIINLANGDYAAGEDITGGGGTDTIVLTNATTIDFSIGTITDLDAITGSTSDDTVTLLVSEVVGVFDTIDLSGGTDILNTKVSGTVDVSADTAAVVSNVETGNITGSAGADILTAAGEQIDAMLAGSGTISMGGSTDIFNLTSTSADLNTLGATDISIQALETISYSAAASGITLILSGQTENFTLTGSAAADTMTLGSGVDTVTAGAGADTIDAGGGNDIINLANGDFVAGESITGGGGTDSIVLTNATTVDFTTGTLATVETLTGSGSGDTVTMGATTFAGILTTIDLSGGTDTLNVTMSGTTDISAAAATTVSNTENGNLTGSSGDDVFTLTGTQLNGMLGSTTGTIAFGGGDDTLILTSTSTRFNTTGATDGSITGLETITVSGSPAITISISGQTEDFTINGGGGIDTITGGRGDTTINGNGGADVIASTSQDTLTAQATAITTANAGVVYNATTDSFYKYVNSAVTWAVASAAATATVINGVAGHLVQIDSATENTAIDTLGGANPVWLGVNDTGTEGTFLMVGGPMNNVIMRSGGAAQNGIYANWAVGNPSASAADDDYIRQETGGTWTDQVAATTSRYVIEWEGSQLIFTTSATTIIGGAGADTLTGGAGKDIFQFDAASTGSSDTINGYNFAHHDVLDISQLLSGYIAGTSDPDDFARFTVSGADLLLQIDDDGTVGGASFTTIATLVGLGTSGLNVTTMVNNNFLITNVPAITFYFDWGSGNYTYNANTIANTTFTDTDIGYGVSGNDQFSINRTSSQAILDYISATAPGNLTVTGSANNDRITVSGAISVLTGIVNLGAGNDTLTITAAGNYTIAGGIGTDNMTAGAGTDIFNLANGDFVAGESITGGGGTDTLLLTNATTVDFSTGTLATLETFTGSSGNDTVTMTLLQFAGFSSTFNLGAGTNVLSVTVSGTVDVSALSTPTVSNVTTGNLSGSTGADVATMIGGQLDGILNGTGILDLAGGTDTLGLTSTSTDLNGLSDARLVNVETISASTAGAGVTITLSSQTEGFTVTGSSSGDTITGGSGGDTIDGGNGDDTLNGNGGTDTVTYVSASSGVTVSLLLQGASQNTVGAGNDTLSSFENLTGSTLNDTLTGDGNNNTIIGGTGSDTILGGNGVDVIYGNDTASTANSGADAMYGEGGNDTIYSASRDTLAAQITAITGANPGVVYNSTTGSFYKYVNSSVSWTTANTAASGTTINGVAGHLAQINNSAENSAIDTLGGSNSLWLGMNDAGTEGTFKMIGGLMDGISFWLGTSGGSAQNFLYTNWRSGNPSAGSSDDDYVRQRTGGQWYDATAGSTYRYVIEWEGKTLLTPTESTTLSGGAGTDTLYGSAGQDIFLFEASTAGTNDTINSFDRTDLDKLDISDLLTGYTAGVSDNDAFARFTVSGANLLLQVDANGTTGGASYSTVATLVGQGTSGMDIEELVAVGLLLMT